MLELNVRNHKKYFNRFLKKLPANMGSYDTNRITLAYFCLAGLDVLNGLDTIPDGDKVNIINWIYTLQIVNEKELVSGFQGSTTFNQNDGYKWGHIASTYCALCSLLILGDDLSRINKKEICKSLQSIQLPDGSCSAAIIGTENDMRFLFCAAATSYILDDWSGLDVEKATEFILASISYDCGIGQGPDLESHGGSTYCAIATLALCDRLDALSNRQRDGLRRWLVAKQSQSDGGFQGRANKPSDTCYTFWVGGTLHMLNLTTDTKNNDNCNNTKDKTNLKLVDGDELSTFVLLSQDTVIGGFSKWQSLPPDPLHSYLALAGLSLVTEGSLPIEPIVPKLNITKKTYEHLKRLQKSWK